MRAVSVAATLILLTLSAPAGASAAGAPGGAPQMTPAQVVTAQQAAIARLSALDGVWRGTGAMTDRPGDAPDQMTMAVRVGSALDGTLKIIETRGYLANGTLRFHSFNTISFDPQRAEYTMNARAGGRSGNFSFRPTDEGYAWNIGSPEAGIRYTGTVAGGEWKERGLSVAPGREPQFMSESALRRVGATDWPEAGALGPR